MKVFELHYDFRFASFGIVAYGVHEYLVHKAFESVVFAIAKELCAVFLVAYLERVATGKLDEILKDFRATVRYVLWLYCRWTHETFAIEAWKCIIA